MIAWPIRGERLARAGRRLAARTVTAIACAGFGWAAPVLGGPPAVLPLPDLTRPVNLRVLLLHDPRHPALDAARAREVMALAQGLMRSHFGVTVRLATLQERPVESVRDSLGWLGTWEVRRQRLDPGSEAGRQALAQGLQAHMASDGGTQRSLSAFAAPYLTAPPVAETPTALAQAIAATQAHLHARWRSVPAVDGRPIVQDDVLHDYPFWSRLGHTPLAFELVITNHPIVSTERVGNAVHSALRGGLSNGLTSSARHAATGTYSVVSTFAMLSDDEVTRSLRDVERPTRAQADRYIAAVIVHELGHQLLHLGHPFDNPACVMRPPVQLRFEAWVQALDPSRCPLRSEPAMQPGGVVRFEDLRR